MQAQHRFYLEGLEHTANQPLAVVNALQKEQMVGLVVVVVTLGTMGMNCQHN